MEIDPNEVTKAGPVLGGFAALIGAFAGLFKISSQRRKELEAKIDSKADTASVARALQHIEILYKNAETDRKMVRDLHDEAIGAITGAESRILHAMLKQ